LIVINAFNCTALKLPNPVWRNEHKLCSQAVFRLRHDSGHVNIELRLLLLYILSDGL